MQIPNYAHEVWGVKKADGRVVFPSTSPNGWMCMIP